MENNYTSSNTTPKRKTMAHSITFQNNDDDFLFTRRENRDAHIRETNENVSICLRMCWTWNAMWARDISKQNCPFTRFGETNRKRAQSGQQITFIGCIVTRVIQLGRRMFQTQEEEKGGSDRSSSAASSHKQLAVQFRLAPLFMGRLRKTQSAFTLGLLLAADLMGGHHDDYSLCLRLFSLTSSTFTLILGFKCFKTGSR